MACRLAQQEGSQIALKRFDGSKLVDLAVGIDPGDFTKYPPNEASIATLEKRLNPKY
jgi:hypothetical protein